MRDVLYGVLHGATSLDDARYRFHVRRSGLNLPKTLDEYCKLAQCDDVDLDYRRFIHSAAEGLSHWLNHQIDIFGSVAFPQENYFENIDAQSVKATLKDPSEIAKMMLQMRLYYLRINQRILDHRIDGNPAPLIDVFNETMRYYKDEILPESRNLFKTAADGLEKRIPELVDDVKTRIKTNTI
ncbi:MAG: hypothetical protein J4452_02720 [Candidatus Aenigmarchaeota archaeon]|nr:hypothetical protein [Candidatus Aenigmarchaeota archaeon]